MGCLYTKLSTGEIIIGGAGGNKKKAKCVAELISAYEELCILVPELRPRGNYMPRLKNFMPHHQTLLFLSRDYLKSAVATINLLAALKACLSRARDRQAIVFQALKFYKLKNYSETLSKLRDFKEAEDPFSVAMATEFASLHECQQSVIKHLDSNRNKLRDKIDSTKRWRKAWKVMCNAAFVAVLLASVVLAAMSMPPFATVAVAAGCTVIRTGEQWVESVWANRLKTLEGAKDAVVAMSKGELGDRELESVKAMVERIKIGMGSMEEVAWFAMCQSEEEEVAVAMVVEEIEERVGEVEEGIKGVEMKVKACEGEIRKVVAQLLDAITTDL